MSNTDDFYNSKEWLQVRYGAIRSNLGCCQACGARASINIQLHVDHIKPRSKYPDLQLVPSNLQVLCQHCNFGKSNKDETNWLWVPSKELVNLNILHPETKSKLRQLSWLQVNGDTIEIKKDAEAAYRKLWREVHTAASGHAK